MTGRLFLDTSFVQALLNADDRYHRRAVEMLPTLNAAAEVWTTEAVLVEVGNALSRIDRQAAVDFIRDCWRTPRFRVVTVDRELLDRALDLYDRRPDKTWGLTDCLSFVVMQEQGRTDTLTTDRHFQQAGFRALLLAAR